MQTHPLVRAFEHSFAEYQQAVAARAFWMGRAGLYAVLRALGVGPGDRVGICAYTCVAVVEAVLRTGAEALFLDVDRHLNVSPLALAALPAAPKVLILQYTFGVPSQVDAALAWARRQSIPVIEDCCHALGSTWNGRRVGAFGLAAVFSFQWGKSFSTGQGGLVTFQDAGLAQEVERLIQAEAHMPSRRAAAMLAIQRCLYAGLVTPRTRPVLRRVYGWGSGLGLLAGSEPQDDNLRARPAGFFRLCTPSQARVGLRELRRWPENMQGRLEAAAAAREQLTGAGVALEDLDTRAAPVYLRLPVWVQHKAWRLAVAERQHLDLAGWYSTPAHPLTGERLRATGYRSGSCPTAEAAFASVVTLPTRPALSSRELATAVGLLQEAELAPATVRAP
jgi:perosamine synthetase